MTKSDFFKIFLKRSGPLIKFGNIIRKIKMVTSEALSEWTNQSVQSDHHTVSRSILVEHSDLKEKAYARHYESNENPIKESDPGLDEMVYNLGLEGDVDFATMDSLEEYAEKSAVQIETVQQWVAAGILFPDEIKVAEKLIKILKEKKISRFEYHIEKDAGAPPH